MEFILFIYEPVAETNISNFNLFSPCPGRTSCRIHPLLRILVSMKLPDDNYPANADGQNDDSTTTPRSTSHRETLCQLEPDFILSKSAFTSAEQSSPFAQTGAKHPRQRKSKNNCKMKLFLLGQQIKPGEEHENKRTRLLECHE